jgi:hypothetical protein
VIFADTENGPGSFEETPRRLGVAWLATCLCLTALLLWAPAAPAATNNIFTVAGPGTSGFLGDGGPAIAAHLFAPAGVAATADGGFLIADTFNDRVRRVSPTGTITTVAGTSGGLSGDGGPATAAQLLNPVAVAVTADGGFLIADSDNNLVRRVSTAGTISTVAGASPGGFSGDGGPATAAQLNLPSGVAATGDGGFLIADNNNSRVRRVSPAGTITTVAGTGTAGFSGDGGPAIAAQLFGPAGVVATADGGFLIADSLNNRVRRVSLAGTITTVAGDGTEGFLGDSGLATAAQLREPQGLAATADGGFLIADLLNNRVRFVDADLGIPRGPQDPAPQAPAPQAPAPQGAARQGPALRGPAGPAGPVGRAPLAIAFADSRLRVRARQMVTLRYAATDRARVVVRIMRGRRTVARARGRARGAANRIRIRAPRRAGRYRLRLEASTADGRVASARAVLIVRRSR